MDDQEQVELFDSADEKRKSHRSLQHAKEVSPDYHHPFLTTTSNIKVDRSSINVAFQELIYII